MTLKKQLITLQKQTLNPVQQVGHGLTGTIARCIHMFCDPQNESLAVPSTDQSNVVQIGWLPDTSIDLVDGKSNIIVTPTGPYQLYKTLARLLNMTDEYSEPILLIRQLDAGVTPVKTIMFENTNLQTALIQTSGDHFTFAPTANCSLLANVPPELAGCTVRLTFDDNTSADYNDFPGGRIAFVLTGVPYNPDALPEILVPVGKDIVKIDYFKQGTLPPSLILEIQYERIFTAGNQVAFEIPNSLNTYVAERSPVILQLSNGGVLTAGFINSLSAMITNDSSSLNNAGLIQAVSIPGILKNPDYMSFNDWISSQKRYRYRGRLRTGAYQIYVPSQFEDVYTATKFANPWMVNNAWSMVFLIDNSVSVNGAAIPDKTQCHISIDGNLQTPALNNILAPTITLEDPYYKVAVALLRKYYAPCCNPDHKEQIAKWIANTFNGVITRSANYITSKVTEQNVRSALDKGEKFLSGLMRAEGQSLVWDGPEW